MAFAVKPLKEFLHRSRSGPIRMEVSPFDFPQRPERSFRIMGNGPGETPFLVTLGESERECLELLPIALGDYSRKELAALDSIWLEVWWPGHRFAPPEWRPVRTLSLRRVRFTQSLRDGRNQRKPGKKGAVA